MRFIRSRSSKIFFALLFLLATTFLLFAGPPGCVTSGDYEAEKQSAIDHKDEVAGKVASATAERDAIKAEYDKLQARYDNLVKIIDDPATTGPSREDARISLAEVEKKLAATAATLKDYGVAIDEGSAEVKSLERRLAAAEKIIATLDGPNAGSTLGSLAGTFIPGLGAAAPVIGGLLWRGVTLNRAKQSLALDAGKKSTALDKIVSSIDALAAVAPEVAAAIASHKPMLDKIQGPETKLVVDQVQEGLSPAVVTTIKAAA